MDGRLCASQDPPDIIAKINAMMQEALNSKEIRASYDLTGAEPTPGPPDDLDRFVKAELAKWGAIIRTANIEPE